MILKMSYETIGSEILNFLNELQNNIILRVRMCYGVENSFETFYFRTEFQWKISHSQISKAEQNLQNTLQIIQYFRYLSNIFKYIVIDGRN